MLQLISLLLPPPSRLSLQVITSETSASTAWGTCSGLLSPLTCLPTNSSPHGTRWRWSAWRGGCGSRCCARLGCPSRSTGACRSTATSTCSWMCELNPLPNTWTASWQEKMDIHSCRRHSKGKAQSCTPREINRFSLVQ